MNTVARVRDIEMSFTERGSGPSTLVLLHGFLSDNSMWREQAEALHHARRIIIPDLRGHGQTTAADVPATMEEMARDIAALLDELRVERITLGGLSMGGYVTLAFYSLFPERVRALVLADTRAEGDTEDGKRVREETAFVALSEGVSPVAEAMLPKLLTRTTLEQRPEVVERMRRMLTSTKPVGAASASRGMAMRQDMTGFLAQISVPTLIIVGSEDVLTPPVEAEKMHRAIRGSRLEIIEGAGHVSNVEQPAKFNRALESFLHTLES